MIPRPFQPVLLRLDLARALVLLMLVAAVGMMAGCATPGSELVEIRVPVPIECRAAKPARPAMPTDALQPADSLYRKVTAALAELELREGYELELVAALDACMTPLDAAAALRP